MAANYLNGQRLSTNWQGFLYNFNRVGSVEILRGPATVTQGFAYASGGSVNYLTKRPENLRNFELSKWQYSGQGESSRQREFSLDLGQVNPAGMAYRFSYQNRKSDTFYAQRGGRYDYHDIFLALAGKLPNNFEYLLNISYLKQAAPQLLGVNRVTQMLIDKNLYQTGSPTTPQGPYTGDTIYLSEGATLLSRGDEGDAEVGLIQLILEKDFPAFKLINRTLIEKVNRHRYHHFEYAEDVEQLSVENRWEFYLPRSSSSSENETVTGFALRLEKRLSYVNYSNEFWNAFDLSKTGIYDAKKAFPAAWQAGFQGPRNRLYFGPQLTAAQRAIPIFPTYETTKSRLLNLGLFHQRKLHLNDTCQLLYGLRADLYRARAKNPLPPPQVKAWEDTADGRTLSGNISLTTRLKEKLHLYATFNKSAAVYGSFAGGGILLNHQGKIRETDLENDSELYETGLKASWLEDRLQLSLSAFQQKRSRHDTGTGSSDIKVAGWELACFYTSKKATYLAANLSLLKGHYINAAPFEIDSGKRNTKDNYDLPGLPTWIANITLGKQLNKLQLTTWLNAWGNHPASIDGTLHIPDQFELNARASLPLGKGQLSIEILNITDQRNWIHSHDAFTDYVLIHPNLPPRLKLSYTLGF